MKELNFNQLRKEYLDFFESKDHVRLKSYSLIPKTDKSLLLINAGMAPLKDYFLGVKKMSKNRATSSQKCIRTGDIDNVGKTHRHATFFEMLGNFSFGDYFKEDAIKWAWEFLTEVIELDKDKISVSVYEEDDEAYNIWKDIIGIPEERIIRGDKEENFWEMEQGPCGPCSEIFYDRGEEYEGDDRVLEVWNLVFTQYNKDADGNYHPLEHPNIDTGMGLERLALVVEDAPNIFELKSFEPLLKKVEELSGKKYGQDEKVDESFRVIMDHSKAMTFLIYDGIVPSNEGRGYVLRRLIRRAYRHGKLIGIKNNFLEEVSKVVMEIYSAEYPELLEDKDRIFKIIKREEDNFQLTIDQGLEMLNNLINKVENSSNKVLSGKSAFKLYDTYGFPLDLTLEIAKDHGIEINQAEFESAMIEQKEKSRASKNFQVAWDDEKINLDDFEKTTFLGYDLIKSEAKVIGIRGIDKDSIEEGDKAIVILNATPFYGESGGQVGDIGYIYNENGKLRVTDTQKNADEVYYHIVEGIKGSVKLNDDVIAEVDKNRRIAIRKNHSATHLLNKALKEVLGNHIKQAGSFVSDERLRFDFTHFEAISTEDLKAIERIVNQKIFESLDVNVIQTSLQEAQQMNAVGEFEDKYKDIVRVIDMNGYSIELCGGTHVSNTSEIMMFKILHEVSVASGVRRIEAITGLNVYNYLNDFISREEYYSSILKTRRDKIRDKIITILENRKYLESKLEELNSIQENQLLDDLFSNIKKVNDVNILVQKLDNISMDSLKNMADKFVENPDTKNVLLLASVSDGKIYFVSSVSKSLIKNGIKAGDIVKFVAQKTGGNGGGRPDFAQAGGKDIDKLEQAMKDVELFIEEKLK